MKSTSTTKEIPHSSSKQSLEKNTKEKSKQGKGNANGSSESWIHSYEILLKLALKPSHSSNLIPAVKKQLNRLLFKYQKNLGGVPIAYVGMRFPPERKHGRFIDDQPWIHIDVLATFVVVKPTPNATLEGKITQISSERVSLLVLGLINVTIDADEMNKKFEFNAIDNTW